MKISVSLDEATRAYIVFNEKVQVAVLPLTYLEGARSRCGGQIYIHPDDIEIAFAKAYGEGPHAKGLETELQRRHLALAELGLIREPS